MAAAFAAVFTAASAVYCAWSGQPVLAVVNVILTVINIIFMVNE